MGGIFDKNAAQSIAQSLLKKNTHIEWNKQRNIKYKMQFLKDYSNFRGRIWDVRVVQKTKTVTSFYLSNTE